jgi:hypothetical protein
MFIVNTFDNNIGSPRSPYGFSQPNFQFETVMTTCTGNLNFHVSLLPPALTNKSTAFEDEVPSHSGGSPTRELQPG